MRKLPFPSLSLLLYILLIIFLLLLSNCSIPTGYEKRVTIKNIKTGEYREVYVHQRHQVGDTIKLYDKYNQHTESLLIVEDNN